MKNFWETNKIRLRNYKSEDALILFEAQNDSDANRVYEPGIYPIKALSWYEKYVERKFEDNFAFAIENLEGDFVGTANINDVDQRNGTFSFAIRVFSDHRRKGFAKDAFTLLLKYGFNECRFLKANSVTIDFNSASVEMHKALGFKIEGRRRNNIYTNGKYHDEVLFGMTKEEFVMNFT